jgi:hypothetical protein
VLGTSMADAIATRNAHPYAESFVKAYDGQTLTLDDDLKIRDEKVIGIDEQISCIAREIAIRERCYPKWVSKGTMKQAEADRELNRMRAVIETLSRVKDAEKLVANVAAEMNSGRE